MATIPVPIFWFKLGPLTQISLILATVAQAREDLTRDLVANHVRGFPKHTF